MGSAPEDLRAVDGRKYIAVAEWEKEREENDASPKLDWD